MSSSCIPRIIVRSLLWFVVFQVAAALIAAEPVGPPDSLKYRRIYVPADELTAQAKGMIPLRRDEFERRIAAWGARQPNSLAAHVRVARATYVARLEKDQLIDGNALLDIVNGTSEPAVFTWDSSLALGKPHWEGQPPQPARLGASPQGDSVLVVEKSGRLAVPWTLRGKAINAQDATFDLQLPKSSLSRLVLQLPGGLTPDADVGIVSRLAPDSEESRLLPAATAGANVPWLIELGGHTQVRLRVRNSDRVAQKGGVVLVREAATHILSPVDVSSEFGLQLDIHQTSLASLKLEIDTKSRVIGVQLGGTPLTWREVSPLNSQQTSLQVDLTEELSGSGNGLTVSVVSPLPQNLPWRLPRLRLPGGTWQEGTATLVAPPTLDVGTIQFTDARQTSISPGSVTQPEQSYQFQYLSPTGQIDVQSSREHPELKVLGGLVVRHEATQLSAILHLDVAVDVGERFTVKGVTNEAWVIDSVDTPLSDLLEDRQFVPLDGRKFALQLRLARPLTAKKRTRLVIRAHRPLPADGEKITAAGLRLIHFQDVREEQLVVALRATESSREFQLSGDLDVFRIDPESAGPEELGLLDSSTAGILFRLERSGEGAHVSLVPGDLRFTAAMESSVLVKRDTVEHHAIARIHPTSSSLTRLIVRSSGPLPAAVRWKLVGAGDLNITSQTLLPLQSPPAADGQKESVWELVLSRLTTQPLTLEAIWESPFTPGGVLPLFSFPEAVGQEGLVRLDGGPGVPLRVETDGVKAVPAQPPSAGLYSTIRGMYRYEPGRQAKVSLHLADREETRVSAWVKRCTLQSRYSSDGAAIHEITWHLENHGLDRFSFTLPQSVRPIQCNLDGESTAMPFGDGSAGQLFVPLVGQRRFPVIAVTVATLPPESSGLLEQHWSAPQVTTSLPVLERHWLATLPPGIKRSADPPRRLTGTDRWREIWYEIWVTRVGGAFSVPARDENLTVVTPWSATEPLIISVYAPDVVRIWGIALAIAAASLVVWLVPHRLLLILLVATISVCTAILLPAAWSPLAAGLFWGTVFGGVISLARPRAAARPAVSRSSSPSSRMLVATSATGSLVLLAQIFFPHTGALAAPDEGEVKGSAAKIHRIVFPVDSDQKPQGDYVYVAPDFFALLYRAPEREQLPAWLLRSSHYDLESTEDGTATNVVMRMEMETLTPQAKIALPLRRGEIHLLEGRSTLDGEPISLAWDDAGTSLRMEIDRPGLYQLSLAFSAAAKQENGATVWNFGIPRSSRTSLRIRAPMHREDWLFPAALGAVAKSMENDDLLADLGPTASFQVSRKDLRRFADDKTEAEQLVWWKLRPGSVTAELFVRIRPVSGKISEIKLLVDPRLRMLPLENESQVSRVWTEEGEPSTIHLTLAEPATETVELRGKVLLLDASGIGRLVLPRLDVVADRKAKQWQAISVSKENEISPDPQSKIVSHPPVDFVDSFGGAPRPPDLAFEGTSELPAFLIRPRESVVHAKESIDVSLGLHEAEIMYLAELSGIPPHRFQEVLDMPAGFRVRQAVLLEQETTVSRRTPAPQQGLLAIHRLQSPSPVQQLLVKGTLPIKALVNQPDLVRLPRLRLAVSDGASIRVYRTPAILATVKSAVGMQPSALPEGVPWDLRLGHLLASYKSASIPQPPVREFSVETRPNGPSPSYRLVTKMELTSPRSWSAVVNCDVKNDSGSLDAVRFEVPTEWSGPFETIPAMDHQMVLLPGQTQRHLVIRPTGGSLGTLHFSIRGPVKFPTGETPHAPVLLPLDANRVDSFVLLPGRVSEENLQWLTSGLQAMAAGEAKEAQLAEAGHEAFRVVAPRFAATLLQSTDSRRNARIVHADVLFRPLPGGGYWARAGYYLLPGGRGEADLKMPIGSQLVQVLVNDMPVETLKQSAGTWKVRFGHDHLPQQVVVIYAHQPDSANNPLQAASPSWVEIPLEKTVWTLLSVESDSTLQSQSSGAVDADTCRAALVKLAAINKMVREAGDAGLAGLPTQQLGAWLSAWRIEFNRISQSAQPAGSAAENGLLSSALDKINTERISLEAQFAATLSRYSDMPLAFQPPEVASDPVPFTVGAAHPIVVTTESSAPLPLAPISSHAVFDHRLGLAIFLLVLAVTIAGVLSRIRMLELCLLTPAFSFALLAVAALVFLPGGHVFAVIFAISAAWFSLRRSWTMANTDTGSRIRHASKLPHHA